MMAAKTYLEWVTFAFLASAAGSVLDAILAPLMPQAERHALLCAALGLACLVHLSRRLPGKPGSLIMLSLSFPVTLVGLIAPLPLGYQLLLQAALIWAVRSILVYGDARRVMADLCLQALALAALAAAYSRTGSVMLSIWSFFLVQASFVFIADSRPRAHGQLSPEAQKEFRFSRALRVAENAIARLSDNT